MPLVFLPVAGLYIAPLGELSYIVLPFGDTSTESMTLTLPLYPVLINSGAGSVGLFRLESGTRLGGGGVAVAVKLYDPAVLVVTFSLQLIVVPDVEQL